MTQEQTTTDRQANELMLQVLGYHQTTKHHFYRYARALGYIDWANQPNPFRRYEEAMLIRLPLLESDEQPVSPAYDALYRPNSVPVQPVTVVTLSRFLEYALALSAWKQAGDTRWALRTNPSSGNLHPTEGYLLLNGISGLSRAPGLYHYAPKEHGLERRADWPSDLFTALMRPFPPGAFLLGLTSVHWRESWKYGERAFRYCQHDVGHAIGSARIAAATLGWKMVLLEDVGDDDIVALLGIGRDGDYRQAEREHPDCLAVVWPGDVDAAAKLPLGIESDAIPHIPHIDRVTWHGIANRLSRDKPDPWEIIDVVAAASWKPRTGPRRIDLEKAAKASSDRVLLEPGAHHADQLSAGRIIRQRRSALAFDGQTSIDATRFFLMLSRVMPRRERALAYRPMPWDVVPWEAAVHLALFVHRVDGLPQGLYVLVRDPAKLAEVREAMHQHFVWTRPPGCPDDLPLYLLEEGDARQLASQVSCHQEIAGAGAFSMGMIAEFEPTIEQYGSWFYRRLFWETGLIGQVLYLEAEAAGVRATGIGCFFDDPVHQVFGLQDMRFQSLYHFTVGGPVDDPRLTTLPAYGE